MKKNPWLIAIATLSFSSLFYLQDVGLNFLLFDLILVAGLFIKTEEKSKTFYLASCAVLAAGSAVFIYGNALSFFANLLALAFLSAQSVNSHTSVFAGTLFSMYTGASSGLYMLLDYIKNQEKATDKGQSSGKWLLWAIPILVVLIFFLLYRASSPVFNQFASAIDFSFISIGWIACTIAGLWLSFAFFNNRKVEPLATYDSNTPNQLSSSENTLAVFGYRLNISEELKSGTILLVMLNLLLLVVNGLDLAYIFAGKIPTGMSYSEYVHQGTSALIFSILIAIGIITVYFRNSLSLKNDHKMLRLLAYGWIIQNAVLVISTMIRNQFYIEQYSLTYLRIGVFAFLTLAFIGLISTMIKIARQKSNYYLIRVNSAAFLSVLIVASLVSWDQLILDANTNKAKQTGKIDMIYLIDELSYSVLPALQELQNQFPSNKEEENQKISHKIAASTYRFLRDLEKVDWRSYTLKNGQVYQQLMQQHDEGKITRLDFGDADVSSVNCLQPLTKLEEITLCGRKFDHYGSLRSLPNLKALHLTECEDFSMLRFPKLPNLETFSEVNGRMMELRGIGRLSSLKKLDVQGNPLISLNGIEELKHLEELNISRNPQSMDVSALFKMTSLKKLYLDQANYEYLTKKSTLTRLKAVLPGLQIFVINNPGK